MRAPVKALSRPAVSSALRTLAVVAALAALLAQVLAHLGPGARAAAAWNSDSAIPLLQANNPVLDAFRLYYYGQDRLGAWPWLLAQALHGLSGFAWSPQRLFVWHASFVLGACLVLLRLHRAAGLALAAAFAALALLAPSVRALLFDVGQPYGWQLTALLLAGWGLDRLVRALALPGAPRLRWAALATVGAVLACWTSPLSGPLLLALLGPQVLRAGAAGAPRGRLAWALVPVLAAVAFERILRGAYHRFSRDHFGHDYRTALQGDWGHLLENARAMGMRALQEDAGPVFVLGLAAALATAGVLLTRARRGSLGSFVSNDAQDAHAALGFLALGFAGAALVNLAAVAASLHVRLNEYSPRYLVPTFVLGALAAASGGLFLLGLLPALRRRLGALSALLALGLTGAALAGVPAWREAPELAQAQAAQALLRARAPAGRCSWAATGTATSSRRWTRSSAFPRWRWTGSPSARPSSSRACARPPRCCSCAGRGRRTRPPSRRCCCSTGCRCCARRRRGPPRGPTASRATAACCPRRCRYAWRSSPGASRPASRARASPCTWSARSRAAACCW